MKIDEHVEAAFWRISERARSGEDRDVFVRLVTGDIVDHPHDGKVSVRHQTESYAKRYSFMGTYNGRCKLEHFAGDYKYVLKESQNKGIEN